MHMHMLYHCYLLYMYSSTNIMLTSTSTDSRGYLKKKLKKRRICMYRPGIQVFEFMRCNNCNGKEFTPLYSSTLEYSNGVCHDNHTTYTQTPTPHTPQKKLWFRNRPQHACMYSCMYGRHVEPVACQLSWSDHTMWSRVCICIPPHTLTRSAICRLAYRVLYQLCTRMDAVHL